MSYQTVARAATLMLLTLPSVTVADDQPMPSIRISPDKSSFITQPGDKPFVPWGFNYDHDGDSRLLEDYWDESWDEVEEDFREMKDLGANVVRVHLQFGRFMKTADDPNPHALVQLSRLLKLAESQRLYLDITGLGCYHKADVPKWYDQLNEADRWRAQANFWEAVAERCADSPAVFCYDLMNEPVSPGGDKPGSDWLGPGFGGKHFVQRISLDRRGRERPEIARRWIGQLKSAIRKHDQRHLVTIGLVPWSLDRPGLTSGFVPERIADQLDFIAMHLYPESGKIDEAIEMLKGFDVGLPVVIEETFPLKCSPDEFAEFMKRSRRHADGWIGFYWGKTREELRQGKTIGDALMLRWLDYFAEHPKNRS